MSLIAANLKIELLTWPDRKKLNLSNGDFIVSIRSSVCDIEAEMRVTSNNKSEKNAIIDYFPCFRSHPFHIKRPAYTRYGHAYKWLQKRRLMLGGASYALFHVWC